METSDPKSCLLRLVSQDDDGLWMKMDFNPVTDYTEEANDLLVGDFRKVTVSVITRYYSVMDDEGADEVFILPLPSSYIASILPTEGDTDSTAPTIINSSVTLTN